MEESGERGFRGACKGNLASSIHGYSEMAVNHGVLPPRLEILFIIISMPCTQLLSGPPFLGPSLDLSQKAEKRLEIHLNAVFPEA